MLSDCEAFTHSTNLALEHPLLCEIVLCDIVLSQQNAPSQFVTLLTTGYLAGAACGFGFGAKINTVTAPAITMAKLQTKGILTSLMVPEVAIVVRVLTTGAKPKISGMT